MRYHAAFRTKDLTPHEQFFIAIIIYDVNPKFYFNDESTLSQVLPMEIAYNNSTGDPDQRMCVKLNPLTMIDIDLQHRRPLSRQ